MKSRAFLAENVIPHTNVPTLTKMLFSQCVNCVHFLNTQI